MIEVDENHLETFSSLGTSLTKDLPSLNHYVCQLYGHKETDDVNRVRFVIFKSGKFSEESLPPTEDSLLLHTRRANYQAYIWRNAVTPILRLPSASDHGWEVSNDGLEITWTSLPVAPDSLLSFISCGCKSGCSSNRCSCKKASLKCSDLCKCKDCENGNGETSLEDDTEEVDYNLEMCDSGDDSNDSATEIESDSDDDQDQAPVSEWETSTYIIEEESD